MCVQHSAANHVKHAHKTTPLTCSSYLKAMGLLYLRFTLPGNKLWEWFEEMLEDEDEVVCKRQGPAVYVPLQQ